MTCTSVTPCTVVVVLLLSIGGAWGDGNGTTSTECYYEEDGITTPCALFHRVECQDVGPITVQPLLTARSTGQLDGRTYQNYSIRLPNINEGYFSVMDLDECWRFGTGASQDTENVLNLHYFRDSGGRDIVVSTVSVPCADLYNSNYSLQVYQGDNGTIEVRFHFKPVSGIQKVELYFMSGECEIACDGSYNSDCEVHQDELTLENFPATKIFTGLRQGYYCVQILHGFCSTHTKTYTYTKKYLPQAGSPNYALNIVVVSLSITGVVTVFIGLVLLRRRRHGTSRQLLVTEEQLLPTQWQNIDQQLASIPEPRKILLLYSRDCREFCDVVQSLGRLLNSFGNLKVLDPLEQNKMEEVSKNVSGWLAQHLHDPDVKVVIVISEGAKLRQRALLNNQIVHVTYPHFLDTVFTQALQHMHEHPILGSNYTRILPVRFEDFTPSEESLSLIVPLKCYVLQKHLSKLIMELVGFNTPIGPDVAGIRSMCPKEVDQLESTIKIMTSYCAAHPHYIKDHFST